MGSSKTGGDRWATRVKLGKFPKEYIRLFPLENRHEKMLPSQKPSQQGRPFIFPDQMSSLDQVILSILIWPVTRAIPST